MTETGYFKNGVFFEYPKPQVHPITVENLEARLKIIEGLLQESLTHHVDVHFKSDTQVIVAGHLNGQDFVRVFDIHPGAFPELIATLKAMSNVSTRGRMDIPMVYPWKLK